LSSESYESLNQSEKWQSSISNFVIDI